METTEDLIQSIINAILDYNRTNILILSSNYKSRNRNIISQGILEYDVMQEVDGAFTKVKEIETVENFVKNFITDVAPLHLFRVQVISKEGEDPSWHTCLDIKPIVQWK